MVEMLVVVTIIGILISLTAAAVLKLIPAQQTINTQSSLTRFQDDLVRAYRSASDKFRKEPIPTSGSMNTAYYGPGGVLAMSATPLQPKGDVDRARVIWTKLRLKQTFPTSFAEAWNPTPLPALSYYQTKLGPNGLGYSTPYFVGHTVPFGWESSVCLLWALQRGEDSQALKESDFGTGSLKDFGQLPLNAQNPSSGTTPSNPPLAVKGLVDDWGTPLAFCRWPVNSTQLNPAGAQPGDKNDSDDPSGLLESTTWQALNGGSNFNQVQAWCHPLVAHTAGAEAQTFRIYPLIVSAGPDKVLGLDPTTTNGTVPLLPAGTGYFATLPPTPQGKGAADNIYPQLASPK